MASPTQTGFARVQRIVATMAATVLVLTVIAIAAIFICRAAGVQQAAFRSGPLAFLAVFPLPGITITLLLLIVLIVLGVLQRTRTPR